MAAGKPISKLDDDAFTRVRVILQNGIESRCALAACTDAHESRTAVAADGDDARGAPSSADDGELVDRRRRFAAETIGYEQVAIEVTSSVAQNAIGIMQVLADPRTTIPQCLDAALATEPIDNAARELLIQLGGEMGAG
jgi:hypothetical protein